MTEQSAERFATALLKQFGKDKVFQFELPEGHNLEYVKSALLRLGCTVDSLPGTNKVTVTVPQIPA